MGKSLKTKPCKLNPKVDNIIPIRIEKESIRFPNTYFLKSLISLFHRPFSLKAKDENKRNDRNSGKKHEISIWMMKDCCKGCDKQHQG